MLTIGLMLTFWGCEDFLDLDSIAASSCPTKPSLTDQDPSREARQLDEGVCTSNDFVGCSVPEPNSTLAPLQCELVLSSLLPVSAGQPSSLWEIWTDTKMIDTIHKEGPDDKDYTLLMDSVKSPASRCLNPILSRYSVENNLLFHGHCIVVPNNSDLHKEII